MAPESGELEFILFINNRGLLLLGQTPMTAPLKGKTPKLKHFLEAQAFSGQGI